MLHKIRRSGRYWYLRFIRLQGSPRSLALGTAIGTFVGITPTMPLHTFLIIAAPIPLRANTLAALLIASLICNPLTIPAQYYVSWKIGSLILPDHLHWEDMHNLLLLLRQGAFAGVRKTMEHLGLEAMLVLLTGGVALAAPLALMTYVLSFRLFRRLQEQRRKKHLLNYRTT